jgi:dTDP-4-dehydrorhamnose reductase
MVTAEQERKMKLCITGGGGFLGSRIAAYYRPHYEIVSIGHGELDICDLEAVRARMAAERPDIVIHCAAISDTWYAEQHPEESFGINVEGSENVARAARENGARLIFMSSDQIYNVHTLQTPGFVYSRDAQREETDDCPINAYARQKQEAEKRLLALDSRTACLRLSWMFDLPREGLKTNSNLLWNLLQADAQGRVLRFAVHEYRGVSYVKDVVERLEAVFSIPGGIYNFGCRNDLPTPQLAAYAAKAMGCAPGTVQEDTERFADAPRNLVMSDARLAEQGIRFPSSQESIARCLSEFQDRRPELSR